MTSADGRRSANLDQPEDVEVDRKNPLANVGSYHPGVFGVFLELFADVHVEEIAGEIPRRTLWPLFTRTAAG